MLEKAGHKILTAGTGVEVLALLEQESFDLILMDCQMPELDGFETTKRIRSSEKNWKSIPIIAMTANAMTGDRELCLQSGMNNYVAKPLNKELLYDVIAQTV
jgi:CheY-like chemotaxis protein